MLGVKLAVSLGVVSCCDKQEKKQHATRSMRHRPTADPTVERGGLAGAGGRSEDTGTGTGTGGGRRAYIGVKRVCGQVGGRRQRAQGGLGARRHVVWRRGTRSRSRRSTGDLWQESSRRRNQLDGMGMSFPKAWVAARCGPPRTPQHSPESIIKPSDRGRRRRRPSTLS
jgi:hypothetical protein